MIACLFIMRTLSPYPMSLVQVDGLDDIAHIMSEVVPPLALAGHSGVWRLRSGDLFVVVRYPLPQTAFASTAQALLAQGVVDLLPPGVRPHAVDRVLHSVVPIADSTGARFDAEVHDGGMQGSGEAPLYFVKAFQAAESSWVGDPCQRELRVRQPYDASLHDLSMAVYADDLCPIRMSNLQVVRHWRLVPAQLELRVRRMQWLQKLLSNPGANGQVITALFSKLRLDTDEVLVDVRLTVHASPYAHFFLNDLEGLEECEGFGPFVAEIFAAWRPRRLRDVHRQGHGVEPEVAATEPADPRITGWTTRRRVVSYFFFQNGLMLLGRWSGSLGPAGTLYPVGCCRHMAAAKPSAAPRVIALRAHAGPFFCRHATKQGPRRGMNE